MVNLLARRREMLGRAARLPSAYQEVEYIESTGTQAILTDIPCQLPIRTDVDILFPEPNDSYFCGTRYGNIRICMAGNYLSTIQWAFGTYRMTNRINWRTRYMITSYLKNGYQHIYNNDGTADQEYNYTLSDAEISGMDGYLGLFAMRYNDTQSFAQFAKARCYGVRISNDNGLLGEFIPCYRKSDGEIGMYDTVSKTFYTNAGTGTFLKGADV